MEFSRWKNLFVVLIMTAVLTAGVSFNLQADKTSFTDKISAVLDSQEGVLTSSVSDASPPPPPPEKLSNPPDIIKAVYITGWSAGVKSYLNYLSKLFGTTEINAVVVDIKDYSGLVSYSSGAEDVKKYNLENRAISDIDSLVRFFHDKNIYVIGRISVFEDPGYSKAKPELAIYDKEKTADLSQRVLWQDNNGLSWVDPASKDVWDYNISLAKDVFYHGFDEVNFDYVRFPSDGKTENMAFPIWDKKTSMQKIIKNFFQYLRANLPDEKLSVDLFGLTAVNTNDMGIGQVIEDAFENFDYVSPMVYPSHYANGFIGFANPAEHPYEVIKYSLDIALNRKKVLLNQKQSLLIKNSEAEGSPASESLAANIDVEIIKLAKLRPWLQDFNMGADYTANMVRQEIKATQDSLGSDFKGFMLWNPSNIYTSDAVKLETKQ
jgi:hypothetical protein